MIKLNSKQIMLSIAVIAVLILSTAIYVSVSQSDKVNLDSPSRQNSETASTNTGSNNNSTGNNTDEASENKNIAETPNNPGQLYFNGINKIANLPESELSAIKITLYETIHWNTSKDPSTVTDAIVRDGSYSQQYDNSSHVYTTKFLVDIPSLQQTYQVQDLYSNMPDQQAKMADYTVLALCPETSQLRWPAWSCTDRLTREQSGQM